MTIDTSPDGLLALIVAGESEQVEFKEGLPSQEDLARLLSAFANTKGGIVIFGVDDHGRVLGLDDAHFGEIEDRLKTVASSLAPDIIHIGSAVLKGEWAAGVSVVYALVNPVPAHLAPLSTSRGEIYTRTGAMILRADANDLPSLFAGRPAHANLPQPSQRRPATVFVAMSFREEEEPALVDYFRAIERAAKATSLPIAVKRVDLVEGDYEISQRVLDEIDNADVVLVDLTLSPRNVYFELGYARGVKRRIIQTARRGTLLEFDIRNWRTLFYRNATELEERLGPELTAAYADALASGSDPRGGRLTQRWT